MIDLFTVSMHEMYWSAINTCMSDLRYDGSECTNCASFVGVDGYKYCGYGIDCLYQHNNYSTLESTNLLLDDYHIHPQGRQYQEIVDRLKEIGILKRNENWNDYYRLVIRIMYNPIQDIIREIRKERQRIGSSQDQIGVHIRCGGNLADKKEPTAMITREMLSIVPDEVKGVMNTSSIPRSRVYVYLSTDSSVAEEIITTALSPIPVKTTILFKRGHSTLGSASIPILWRSLIELYLTSQADYLLLTSTSTFSHAIRWMSNAKGVREIIAPYHIVNITSM